MKYTDNKGVLVQHIHFSYNKVSVTLPVYSRVHMTVAVIIQPVKQRSHTTYQLSVKAQQLVHQTDILRLKRDTIVTAYTGYILVTIRFFNPLLYPYTWCI